MSEDELIVLCELCDGTHGQLFIVAQSRLDKMRNDPVVAQLTLKGTQHRGEVSLEQLFLEADEQKTPEVNTITVLLVTDNTIANSGYRRESCQSMHTQLHWLNASGCLQLLCTFIIP